MIIYTPDTLRASVEAATGGRVTVLYDNAGAPSYMTVIPKFTYEDLGLDDVLGSGVATAFSVNGVEKSEIFIGQYLASVVDGRAVSLPGRAPSGEISYNAAKVACTNKGAGWHLMTAHEWAAIALWCKTNESIPRGNTDFGRAHDAPHETGHVVPMAGMPQEWATVTATGSGPATWRHDGTISGIADLVGNVWEWTDLLKTVQGQIVTTPDNHFTAEQSEWNAMEHYFAIETDPENMAITLQNTPAEPSNAAIGKTWNDVQKTVGYNESELLQRLLISPTGVTSLPGAIGMGNNDEYFACRGGFWQMSNDAGLGALMLNLPAFGGALSIGFRPAFIL